MEPRPQELSPTDAAPLSPAYADPRPWARVLVVDDEPSVVDVFREFLSSQGYDLTVAASGEEALQRLPQLRPDVILTDINLPGLSGLELMRHARRVDPEVVVIVVTGHASASTAIDALRQGANDYVTKPFDLDEVHQIVERGVGNRRLKALNRELVEELREKNEILRQHEQLLRERVRQATLQMTRLYEVGKEISANLDLAPRLGVICGKAPELVGARAAVLYLRVEDTDEFRPFTTVGLDAGVSPEEPPQVMVPSTLLWSAVADPQPVRVCSAAGRDPLALPGLPGAEARSLLVLPMVTEGQVLGVMALLDKPGGFSDDDESFMMLFASQTAIAVRNSQLYEHTKSLDRLKSEFVAVVSHEIRTPLTSVKGAVELLSDERYFQNTEQQGKLLAIAHANTDRLLVLIGDILDFSKLESSSLPLTMERGPIGLLIDQAAHNLRTLLEERHIRLRIEVAEDLPELMMDGGRVVQVLTNLLSNAIKFSPLAGSIEIAADPWEGAVRVSVCDHGEGIAPEHLPKLFRKFSQIDSGSTRKTGGTGLGLVISRGLVEQHGGRIWVESAPGKGSTFYFTLPAEGVQAVPRASGIPRASDLTPGGRRG